MQYHTKGGNIMQYCSISYDSIQVIQYTPLVSANGKVVNHHILIDLIKSFSLSGRYDTMMAFVVQQSLITLVSLSCHGNSFLWSWPSFGNHLEYCDGDCGIDGDSMKMTATPAIMVPEGKIDGDQGQSAGKPRGGRERWIWWKKW